MGNRKKIKYPHKAVRLINFTCNGVTLINPKRWHVNNESYVTLNYINNIKELFFGVSNI